MPTFANSRFPAPMSWDEFEDICRDSFAERWSSPNLVRHGRSGQAQQGIDIYGEDDKANFVGIQCKNTIGTISEALIDAEVTNAEQFHPSIHTLYIASTCDTDAKLQAYVRKVSESRKQQGRFGVELAFWQAIKQDLCRDPALVAKHFPQYLPAATAPISQRELDTKSVTRFVESVDFDSLNSYLDYGAKYIHVSIEEHLTRLQGILSSPTFTIRDTDTLDSIQSLLSEWNSLRHLMSPAPYDLLNNDFLRFHMPGDTIRDRDDQAAFSAIDAQMSVLNKRLRAFAVFILKNYPEIDLEVTSAEARKHYSN